MSVFTKEKMEAVQQLLNDSKTAVIVAHRSPDGDSVGSSVGLYHYLRKIGFDVTICHPDPAPYFLKWMNGTEAILNAEEHHAEVLELIASSDLLFCLDFNTMSRAGILEQALLDTSAKKIVIDHHLNPSDEFDLVFSDTSACATGQLIADFIVGLGGKDLIDKNIGEALYCGMMTDSGSFRFNNVTPHTHEVVALLMRQGLKPYVVHESVFDTNTFDKLRLHSFAINEQTVILEEFQTAIIYLNKIDLERFNYVKGDTEGLVNVGLSIQGIRKSIFLMEGDGIIKISFRSKGTDNPINAMAGNYFSGGGHANAAGGKWEGTMEEAIAEVKRVLPEFS